MRRLLAIFSSVAMLSAASPTSGLHVHAYTSHDHSDHHHGPAAHAHDVGHHLEGLDESHDRPRLDRCTAGAHVRPIILTCVSAPAPQIPDAIDEGVPDLLAPLPEHVPLVRGSDIRLHGPPGLPAASLRAPPATHLS